MNEGVRVFVEGVYALFSCAYLYVSGMYEGVCVCVRVEGVYAVFST